MNKAIRLSLVVLSALILIAALRAQAPEGPPKPGSEHEKLAYFVGKWTSEGEAKATPLCSWRKIFCGRNLRVVCRQVRSRLQDRRHHDGRPLKGMSVLELRHLPEVLYLF